MTLDWYYLPPGATLAKRRSKPAPVIVAKGHLTCSGAGSATVKIVLTAAGRRLLRHAKRLKLSARDAFALVGQPPVSATKTIMLTR